MLLLLALGVFPASVWAQSDPLDPSYMPAMDTNPADYPANVWVTGPLNKVRQDSGSPGALHWATIYATKNEFQGFQVHVQAPIGGISGLNVTMSDLVNPRTGTRISASSTDIIVYREAYLNVTNKTATGATFFNAVGYYPDILIPAKDPYYHQTTNAFPVNVAANQNQSVWIDVHVPSAAPSGYYAGTVTVSGTGMTTALLPVVYAVWNWQMPSTATVTTYGGVDFPPMCTQAYGGYLGCVNYPGAGGSADMGVMYSQVDLAVLGLDHRQTISNNVYPPATPPNFSTFETGYGPLLAGTPAHTQTILPGAKLTTLTPFSTGSSVSAATAQAWVNEATAHGWGSALMYYNVDEPSGSQWSTVIANAAGPHGASPILPVLLTADMSAVTANGAQSTVDWMVPNIVNLEPVGGGLTRSDYDSWLSGQAGRRLFSYQSCSSAGTCTNGSVGPSNYTYPNLNVDGKPVANRAMEWLTVLHNQSGELYYDYTYCWTGACGSGTTDPWTSVYYSGGNGDGTLVYPGTNARIGVATPIWLPSMRMKHMRDGLQDAEYMLALKGAGQASFVTVQISSWVTNSYTFNTDPDNNGSYAGTLTAARQALGTKLHQLSLAGADLTPPTVAITTPAAGATLSGTVTVSGTAADNVAVASVLVSVDGGAFASASGTGNWTFSLNTASLSNGSHTLTAKAVDTSGNATLTGARSVTVNNVVADVIPPTVAITSPTAGATLSGTVTVSGTAADNVAVGSVLVSVDGGAFAPASGTGNWTFVLNTGSLANGSHTLAAKVVDTSGNAAVTGTLGVSVSNVPADTTPPTVAFTWPLNGATVSGLVTLQGTASDKVAVAWVQFLVNGSSVGAQVTAPPYQTSWNASGLPGGTYQLQAVAADTSGNQASAAVTVRVRHTRLMLSSSRSGRAASGPAGAVVPPDQAIFAVKTDDPGFPAGAALTAVVGLPSGSKTFALTQADTCTYYATVASGTFSAADFAMADALVSLAVGTVSYVVPGEGNGITAKLGGIATDASGLAQVVVSPGGITQDAQISVNAMAPDLFGARSAALKKQGLTLIGPGRDIVFSSSGTVNSASLVLPYDPALLPANSSLGRIALAYYNANTGRWEIQNGSSVLGNAVSVQVTHFSPYAPVLILPSSAPGLRNSYAYPSPAVGGQDPTIRAQLGQVDSVDITIFDVSGRAVHSATLGSAPTGVYNGDYYYDYTWTGTKASGVYFAVIHGHASDGSVVRARTKFAVIR